MSAADLLALRDRIRAATGPEPGRRSTYNPDKYIHDACMEMLRAPSLSEMEVAEALARGDVVYSRCIVWNHGDVTASIDAALALVERVLPGWGYMLRRHQVTDGSLKSCVSLLSPPDQLSGDTWDVWAGSTPLAILDALLTALIEREGKG